MKKLFDNFIKSFTTDSEGFSARKLSAFVAVITAIYVTAKEIPQETQIHALYAWLCFALICLGIVTIEQIIRFKNGSNNISENGTPTP
jgi:hypothetical protein